MNYWFALTFIVLIASCAHHREILPQPNEVKLSREAPDKTCKELGPISGTTSSAKATREDAVADLKREAANKGANFVLVREFSGYGTTVTGVAYECP